MSRFTAKIICLPHLGDTIVEINWKGWISHQFSIFFSSRLCETDTLPLWGTSDSVFELKKQQNLCCRPKLLWGKIHYVIVTFLSTSIFNRLKNNCWTSHLLQEVSAKKHSTKYWTARDFQDCFKLRQNFLAFPSANRKKLKKRETKKFWTILIMDEIRLLSLKTFKFFSRDMYSKTVRVIYRLV